MTLRPIHTPGHTPEHTSFLVLIDGEPVALFSGGSLLVGSAGRSDLLGAARAGTLARLQHFSLHRLAALPRGVSLLPTHGEGSFCTTSGGGGALTSTIGAEVDTNPLLALATQEEFVARLTGQPAPIPAYYERMAPANLLGPPPMPRLEVPEVSFSPGTQPVDMRQREETAAGFLPGSLAIELDDDFGSWAAWLLPPGAPVTLVASRGQDIAAAVTQLAQVGADTVAGVIYDLSNLDTATFELYDLPAARRFLAQPGAQLLDVRMPSEHAEASVEGAAWRFLPNLITEGIPSELDLNRPILVACASGRRATIAASIVHRAGGRPIVLSGAGVADLAPLTLRGSRSDSTIR